MASRDIRWADLGGLWFSKILLNENRSLIRAEPAELNFNFDSICDTWMQISILNYLMTIIRFDVIRKLSQTFYLWWFDDCQLKINLCTSHPDYFRSFFQTLPNLFTVPTIHKIVFTWHFWNFHSLSSRGAARDGFCLEVTWILFIFNTFIFNTIHFQYSFNTFVIYSLSLSSQILKLWTRSFFFNVDGFIWHIRFDRFARRSNFWEAKNGGLQWEKLENIRKKKEKKNLRKAKKKNNNFFCYFIALSKKNFLHCNYILG